MNAVHQVQAPPGAELEQLDQLAQHLLDHGGTLAQWCGSTAEELDAGYAVAHQLYQQGRWEAALQVFGLLCRQDHMERRFHVGRAACLQMLRRYDAALEAYGVAHVLDVSEPQVALHIAECLIALDRRDDAGTALDSVAALCAGRAGAAATARRAQALATLLTLEKEAS